MNIAILGPQGSGKGTQAKLLAQKYDLFYFDMGKFLREESRTEPLINEYVNKEGKFLPEEISSPLAIKFLDEKAPERDGIIFDGFPRSTLQLTSYLDKWLSEKNKKINYAVLINISEEETIRRLSNRRVCNKCGEIYNLLTKPAPNGRCKCGGDLVQREDDKPEAIKQRLEWSNKLGKPLIEVFKKRGILTEINGERPISVIFKDIVRFLD
jgi:adenylate kinase